MRGITALITGLLVASIACLPANAGGPPMYNLGLGIVLNGRAADGAIKATVVLRNLDSQPSGHFRLNFGNAWKLGSASKLQLKQYGSVYYSPVLELVGRQIKSYSISAKTADPLNRNCVAAFTGDQVNGTGVTTKACSLHDELQLAMFVSFPRRGPASNLTVTIHNYGKTTSAPFYLWTSSTEGGMWSRAYAGVPAGKDRVLRVQTPPVNGTYSVSLAFQPSWDGDLITDTLQQGLS